MSIASNAFRTELFDTTYQDMAGVDWRIVLKSKQEIYTGIPVGETLFSGDSDKKAYAVQYTADTGNATHTFNTVAYVYEDGSGNDFLTAGSAMAYFLANYTAGVDYVDGTETEIEVAVGSYGYHPQLDMANPGLGMRWEGATSKYKPINGSSASATFITSLAQAERLDIAALNREGNLQIQVWKNGDVFWYGYALPETISVNIDEDNVSYDITFTDGLGLLKSKNWLDRDGSVIKRKISVLDAITLCLEKIPSFDLWEETSISTFNQTWMEVYGSPQPVRDTATLADNGDVLAGYYNDWDFEQADTLKTIFFMGNTMDATMKKSSVADDLISGRKRYPDCYSVLQHILTAFGMEICLFNGHWVIYNRPQLVENSSPKRWQYYYASGAGDLNSNDAFQNLIGPIQARNNLKKAYGHRKLLPDYHGPIMRVRNMGTGAEEDIFPGVNGHITDRAISAVGAGQNVGVVIWYDQSGNQNHAYVEGYYNGTATWGECPLIGTGNGAKTTIVRSGNGNVPAMKFDGVDDHFIAPPVLANDGGFTIMASVNVNDTDGGVANTNNTVYAHPSDDGVDKASGLACNIHYHTTNGYQVNANVFGNIKFDTDSSAWDDDLFTWTFPGGGQINDIQAYQGATALTISSSADPYEYVNLDNNTVRIGTYYLNETTQTYSDYFVGNMHEILVYDIQKPASFVSDVATNTEDHHEGNDGDAVTAPGPYARSTYDVDLTYSGKSITDYGALSKRANKRFEISANNVVLRHIEQGGDILFAAGKKAYSENQTNKEFGYTIMPREDEYTGLNNEQLELNSTHTDGYTTQGKAYEDPTNEGSKPFVTNDGTSYQFRTSGLWSRNDQRDEWNSIRYTGETNPWRAYNITDAEWEDDKQDFTYNGRYVGPPSYTVTDLNLEAGTPIEVTLEGILKVDKSGTAGQWSHYFAGATPVFRARVEATDKDGNRWRLFRPVRTYDVWENGDGDYVEHQIPLETGAVQAYNDAGFQGVLHVPLNEVDFVSTAHGSIDTYSSGDEGVYVIITTDHKKLVYKHDINGSGVSEAITNPRFDMNDDGNRHFFLKDMVNTGSPSFGNWVPHPDNTAGTTGSTTAEWEDAWFEVVGMHGDTVKEEEGYDFSPTPLEYKGYTPMLTKHIGGDDSEDLSESLDFTEKDDNHICKALNTFSVNMPGPVGETEIISLYFEFGTELFNAYYGPRPWSEDHPPIANQSYALRPVDASTGKINPWAMFRSANADGTGGYSQHSTENDKWLITDRVKRFGVTSFYVKLGEEGEERSTEVLSYADGGLGEEGFSLGSTLLGSRFGGIVGSNLGRLTSYLMNFEGGIDQEGWWKLKWRTHEDTADINDALSAGEVFTSLHQMVAWQWLQLKGHVRKQLLIDVIPTTGMTVSGPIAPFLPLDQQGLLAASYNLTSKVLPNKVNWTMEGGTKADFLELQEYEKIKPTTTQDTTFNPVTVGIDSKKPSPSPVVPVQTPYLTVKGSGSTTSYSSFTSTRGKYGASSWGTPQQYNVGWTGTEVEILNNGIYTIDFSVDVRDNQVGDLGLLEVHVGTSSGFTPGVSTKVGTLARKATETSINRDGVMTGSITKYFSRGDFIKPAVLSLNKSITALPFQFVPDTETLSINVTAQQVLQKPTFGDVPVAPLGGI